MMRAVSLESLDRLGIAFLVLGKDGTVRYASAAAARRLGGGAEDIVGRPLPDPGIEIEAEEPLERGERFLLLPQAGAEEIGEAYRTTLQVVGRVRHEINNPLMGVLGLLELVLAKRVLDDDLRRRLETIATETRRIRDQVAVLGTLRQPESP